MATPLLERLQELGFVEGRNLTWTHRSAERRPERLPRLAAELLQAGSQVLVAGFGTVAAKAAKAAKAAMATTPIVLTCVGDPVGAGLVSSLSRPGHGVEFRCSTGRGAGTSGPQGGPGAAARPGRRSDPPGDAVQDRGAPAALGLCVDGARQLPLHRLQRLGRGRGDTTWVVEVL